MLEEKGRSRAMLLFQALKIFFFTYKIDSYFGFFDFINRLRIFLFFVINSIDMLDSQ